MLNLELKLHPETEERFKRVLGWYNDKEILAQNIIACQIAELRRAIFNIRLDMKCFEDKYQLSTEDFYQKFVSGSTEDTEDMIIWAGMYEMLLENESRLEKLA